MSIVFPKEQLVSQHAAKNNKLFRKPEGSSRNKEISQKSRFSPLLSLILMDLALCAVYHTDVFASSFLLLGLLAFGKRKRSV